MGDINDKKKQIGNVRGSQKLRSRNRIAFVSTLSNAFHVVKEGPIKEHTPLPTGFDNRRHGLDIVRTTGFFLKVCLPN
ncbi:hypothetical protein KIN20_031107 [Parelaphostrongylus tenuis]|uniref:Uncharacterized protein n=1 Tax=Parelaphostrongylus tenuis TaxID=148309 RepID=A0AAD5R565_PARTN|nr:hypothetical protein KIN20_031107 [Parelaphostrongylus tenuis]